MRTLIDLWQYLPYSIDPVALTIGPLEFRWYSIMYILGICSAFYLYYRSCKKQNLAKNIDTATELLFYIFLGIILGSRIGYALFYESGTFLSNPVSLFSPYQNGQFTGISGLSYHGGAIGFILALLIYCKKYKLNFFRTTNLLSLYIPLGYTFGRIGNFFNQELYGRTTSFILGMYFPSDPNKMLRYPSQLIESFFEGFILFLMLYLINKHTTRLARALTPIYCILYGITRFLIEFIREPDSFQVLFLNIFTYGQILSIIMIVLGLLFIPIYMNNYEKNT